MPLPSGHDTINIRNSAGSSMIRHHLHQMFIKPRQFMIVDAQSGKPARNLAVRPISLIVAFLITVVASALLGTQLNHSGKERSLLPQYLQLQRLHEQQLEKLSEANANLELKDQQLDTLQKEMSDQQEHLSGLSKRLRMLESILEARKTTGVQLLEAGASWVDNSSIRYQFTLVKGGSYPRWASGSLALFAQSPDGEKVTLELEKQLLKLPFRMETHTFMRGLAQWNHDWFPEKLQAIIYNHKGKELLQMELPIEGELK